MSRSKRTDRVNVYVTCMQCNRRTKTQIDPDDSAGTIGYWCKSCDGMTEHDTGGVRF